MENMCVSNMFKKHSFGRFLAGLAFFLSYKVIYIFYVDEAKQLYLSLAFCPASLSEYSESELADKLDEL